MQMRETARANQIISNSNSVSQVERISQPPAGEAKLTVRSCPQLSIKTSLERPCKAFCFLQKSEESGTAVALYCGQCFSSHNHQVEQLYSSLEKFKRSLLFLNSFFFLYVYLSVCLLPFKAMSATRIVSWCTQGIQQK